MVYTETTKHPTKDDYNPKSKKTKNKEAKETIKDTESKDFKIYGVKKKTDFLEIKKELPRPLHTMLERGGGAVGIFAPPGSGKCLERNQLVEHKEKGDIKIKDVKIGDFINSKNGFVEVINIYDNGIKQTSKTTLKNNMEIISTLDHKIETLKGEIIPSSSSL